MAAATAVYYVLTQEYNDPAEPRPKNDQAVVFDARKDVSIKEYVEELNKIIPNPASFLFATRISKDRVSIVLASAELANKLVEEVGKIVIHGEEVTSTIFNRIYHNFSLQSSKNFKISLKHSKFMSIKKFSIW